MIKAASSRSAGWAVAAICALSAPSEAAGATRALVVGIDTYSPPAGQRSRHAGRADWQDLKGASADAGAIHALLLARYGFADSDVRLLQDRAATRQAILDGLHKHLGAAKRGDTAFFYYAGHGSQVTNSKSKERNRLDESLVPADSWQGVPDVRDKELARAFAAILDAGIRLVVIFDSCHSGSASRGPAGAADAAGMRARKIHPSAIDAADDYVPPSRAGKDFLALSAAQDFQLAWEAWGDDGLPRGLFSLALQRAMQTAAPDEPVDLLFRRVQSAVATARDDQDPVIEADPARLKQPLFAPPASEGSAPAKSTQAARTVVGVVGVAVDNSGGIKLGGGTVIGLTPGAELVPLVPQTHPAAGVRLEVTTVQGPTRSLAKVIAGPSAAIEGGLLLAVDKWGPPAPTALRLHVPPADLSADEIRTAASAFRRSAARSKLRWIDDPALPSPADAGAGVEALHTLSRAGGAWVLSGPGGGRTVTPKDDLGALTASAGAAPPASLYLNLPTPKELDAVLKLGPRAALAPAAQADYHLAGRWSSGRLEYAWVRPWGGRSNGDGSSPADGSSAKTTLPARTDWFDATRPSYAATELSDRAARLARIHHWLTTDGPPSDGTFPYQLAIFDADTKDKRKAYKVSGTLTEGTRYNLALVATRPVAPAAPPVRPIAPRYAYVFVLDKNGKSTVILPFPGKGDVENLFPPAHDPAPKPVYQLLDQPLAWVGPPYGTDTYVLLTTRTKLPDPTILEGKAVRTRGITTGPTPTGPTDRSDWSLQRVIVQSAPAPPP